MVDNTLSLFVTLYIVILLLADCMLFTNCTAILTLPLATSYGLNGVQCGLSVIKESVWLCFKQKVQF